jgi:CheY-like chemotaxis protein
VAAEPCHGRWILTVRLPRVAVIDDDDEFVELMQALLEEEGYAFLRVPSSGADPVDEVAAGNVDAAILDLRGVLPDGGLALLARIRQHPALADLPVLVCSADIQALRDNADVLAATPGVGALEKPFRIEALIGALERLVAGSTHRPVAGMPDAAANARIREGLAELGSAMRWPSLDAWVPDARPGMLHCAAAWAATSRLAAFTQVSRRTLLPFGGGLPGRVWTSGRATWIEDLAVDMNFPRLPVARRGGLVSAAAVPVADAHGLAGVLALYDQRVRPRDDRELGRIQDRASAFAGVFRAAAGVPVTSETPRIDAN